MIRPPPSPAWMLSLSLVAVPARSRSCLGTVEFISAASSAESQYMYMIGFWKREKKKQNKKRRQEDKKTSDTGCCRAIVRGSDGNKTRVERPRTESVRATRRRNIALLCSGTAEP